MNRLTPNQQKALDYTNHISLTANAGSGKTFVLSKRFIEIVLKEKIPLTRIVAITFTDKAASELYKKISEQIEELLIASQDRQETKQLESMRRQLISSNISTIHSFCMNILREFPVEAELDANFILIDEKLSLELIELSIEKIIRESLNNEDGERVKMLIRMFSSKNILEVELKTLVKNFTKVLFIEDKIYGLSTEEITKYYDKIIIEYFEKLIGSKLIQIKSNLILINQTVIEDKKDNELALKVSGCIARLTNNLNINQVIQTLSDIKETIFTKTGKISARGYLKKDLRSNIELQCAEVESNLEYLKIFKNFGEEKKIWYDLSKFGKEMLYFFRKCLNYYEDFKTENGYLDYEDILFKTYNILKNPKVSEFLSEKYNYLMIDEYQDTNEIQYNIFLPLLDDLKKGNLFVVGDEKQSIYMFREAELEIFQRTKADIVKVSGLASQLKLPDSFRMKPDLCLFTNALFREVFNNPDSLFNEVNPSDIICAQSENETGTIEILFYNKDKEIEKSESELVAKRIINLIFEGKGKFTWGDIAILCRKRKSFSELEKKLAAFNIPFIIMGGREFYQRQSIYDIYNYFSFLLENENDTALVGLLRSPFFSLSDNDIYLILQEDGKTFWQKINSLRIKKPVFEKVCDMLKENILLAVDIDFASLLRKILRESSFISVISSRVDGVQETANIEKLVLLTSDFMREGYKTLYDYVNFLKESILEKEDEPQASISEGLNAVKIMTLHQSKGLEFPVVVLYQCNDVTQNNIVKTKTVIADKNFGLLTKMPIENSYYLPYQSSTINEISNFISGKKEYAEAKRLFYVGVTRAKEHLIISFESNNKQKVNAGSFIFMLKNALNVDFERDFINVGGKLTYLIQQDGNYKNVEKNRHVEIPILNNMPGVPLMVIEPQIIKDKILEISSITDTISGDTISATKFSLFSQCPLRYYYHFELGVRTGDKKLTDEVKNKTGGKILNGTVKGKIIHSLLEEKTALENIITRVKIKSAELNLLVQEETRLVKEIYEDLSKYYASETFKEITEAENYNNEFELYVKEGDYYLYGRIDKVIFYNDKIKILDYKTDDILPAEIKKRGDQYLSQLKFYAYILSRFFVDTQIFELQVVFIKNPEVKVQFRLNKLDIKQMKDEIGKMIEALKTWTFIKNTDYCPGCSFKCDKLNCIKEK